MRIENICFPFESVGKGKASTSDIQDFRASMYEMASPLYGMDGT